MSSELDVDLSLLVSFLDCHALPSAIVSYDMVNGRHTDLSMVYANSSFTAWLESIELPHQAFKEWAEDPPMWEGIEHGKTKSIPYARLMWCMSAVGNRFGILQSQTRFGDRSPTDSNDSARPRKRVRTDELSWEFSPFVVSSNELQRSIPSPAASASPEDSFVRILDWTRHDIPDAPEFVQWLRNYDWSRTRVGPMASWNPIVRQYAISIVSNPQARAIYFGLEDPFMLYNEACSKLLGHRHPEAMGVHGSVGAGPAWATKYSGIKEVWLSGQPAQYHDYYHPVPRGGLPWEEAYFSWSVLPISDDNGRMVGVMKEFWESTTDVVLKRRQQTLDQAENMIAWGDGIESYWSKVRQIIEANTQDFPFCIMYSAPQDPHPGKRGHATIEDLVPTALKLEKLVGLESDHPIAVDSLDLTEDHNLLVKLFRTAWISEKNIIISDKEHNFPKSLQVKIPRRGLDSRCRSALICPIKRVDGPGSVGFLFFAINPQRPYDAAYQTFVSSLMDKFMKAAAGILVPEEREKLRQRWQKARDQERAFTKLANLATVGLALYSPSGELKWRNPTYATLTNLKIDECSPSGYSFPTHPDDRHIFDQYLAKLAKSDNRNFEPIFQFRVLKNFSTTDALNKPEAWRWLLAHASREWNEHDELEWIGIYVTDITPQLVEKEQRLEDALETKRQSDNFIDMTCHEMRNPLSAIIQSADGILTSFDLEPLEVTKNHEGQNAGSIPDELQASILDSVQTILLCAQHQKRIVDDTLTLSKLDSNLLLIAPDRVKPTTLVERVLSMYEAELAEAKIAACFKVEQTYTDLGIDWILLDPARLLQILINLLTNAIKFTRKEDAKKISVVLGASVQPPCAGTTNVSFIPQRTARADPMSAPEWGKGEDVYLQFDVCDTGKGLTAEEVSNLFRRFSQASAKTYSQYGGSGLGLFISRELTELQGGQIGVYSVPGQGSTFAFYIKARRYKPEAADERLFEDESTPGVHSAKKTLAAALAYENGALSGTPHPRAESSIPNSLVPSDLHILLVEDNLINQKVTANQLRKVGCTVHIANHGVECLAVLEKSCFWRSEDATTPATALIPLSVILLDQEMPVMDGLTCVRKIREWQREGKLNGHVPVIACTGNARREQVVSSLEAGMVKSSGL
ncbi:uncharacterized protein K460DRAFT_44023 [Cucurbitaria berberidis CBS 394.84]|uniref:Uncharacterized protein n=1 Tax=Cucurbitaria berberidis CBS 394.84 TaxID=1168544 RepID=A0A9P4LFC6_9PLEO|nr:uncharacterized protein K460DRAFT_44023 [Cucurbitaria berberidis CBS 394.84]KAF1851929.1 hypothetical protein K460DRAFT_44023 [Cucurbitaria berberidis CBS 394.84]